MKVSLSAIFLLGLSATDAKVSSASGPDKESDERSLWSAPAWNKWGKPTGRPLNAWNGWNWDGTKWNWSWGGGWGPSPTDKPTVNSNAWDNSWSGKGSSDWVLNGWGGDTWTSNHAWAWAGNGWSWSPKNPDTATASPSGDPSNSPSQGPSEVSSNEPSNPPSVSPANAEEPNFPANRLKFEGTAFADNSDCGGDPVCETSLQFELRDTLQDILCRNLPGTFLPAPCSVSVLPLTTIVASQDEEGGRRRLFLIGFVLSLTAAIEEVLETITEAAEDLFEAVEDTIVETLDTTPYEISPIPQDITGYQFVGHGYCADHKRDYFGAACEYCGVNDVQTCVSLCKDSPCFNADNGFTLAGIDWYESSGTCYCLKKEVGDNVSCPTVPDPFCGCGHDSGDGVGEVWFTTYPNNAGYSCFRVL